MCAGFQDSVCSMKCVHWKGIFLDSCVLALFKVSRPGRAVPASMSSAKVTSTEHCLDGVTCPELQVVGEVSSVTPATTAADSPCSAERAGRWRTPVTVEPVEPPLSHLLRYYLYCVLIPGNSLYNWSFACFFSCVQTVYKVYNGFLITSHYMWVFIPQLLHDWFTSVLQSWWHLTTSTRGCAPRELLHSLDGGTTREQEI